MNLEETLRVLSALSSFLSEERRWGCKGPLTLPKTWIFVMSAQCQIWSVSQKLSNPSTPLARCRGWSAISLCGDDCPRTELHLEHRPRRYRFSRRSLPRLGGFNSVKAACDLKNVGGVEVQVSSLARLIKPKTAAGRPRDLLRFAGAKGA